MDWLKNLVNNVIFQTVISTVISGVFVFVLGDILQKFVLEPFNDYKKIIGKIDNKLKFYANKIFNDSGKRVRAETEKIIRELSCDLESSYKQIPKNFRFMLPEKTKIAISAKGLIFLSNTSGTTRYTAKMAEVVTEIRKNLNIEEL